MSYLINPVADDRCVFVSYEGVMPSAELSVARREANGLLSQQHWNRILVDVTQLQSLPTPALLFDHTKAIAAEVPRGVRVALLVRPDQVQAARLVERIARSDGVLLTYFLDPDEAALWVKQSTPDRQILRRNGKEQP